LAGTKRTLGGLTASQIASASAQWVAIVVALSIPFILRTCDRTASNNQEDSRLRVNNQIDEKLNPAVDKLNGNTNSLAKFEQRWGKNLPRWRRAILIGQAKRLALMSDEERSSWGRSMLAQRGGHAVQHRYKMEGRHPTTAATRTRILTQARKKRTMEEEKRMRSRYGVASKSKVRVAYLSLD
jgi:hypothetical protein